MKKILSNKKSKITLIFSLVGIILIASLILSVFAGTKKSTGNVNNEETTPTPTIIAFTIGENEYSAYYEMTWADWLESEYNTLELTANENGVVIWSGATLTRNGYSVLTSYYIIENAKYDISNLIGSTWQFNDNLPSIVYIDYLTAFVDADNFYSAGYKYFDVYFSTNGDDTHYCRIVYNSAPRAMLRAGNVGDDPTDEPLRVYSSNSWLNNGYRTITIISGNDVENAEFISFMKANATLI